MAEQLAPARPAVLRLDAGDNVLVALRPLHPGEQLELEGLRVMVASEIAFGHKLAAASIQAGGAVVKYGEVIGRATEPIGPGEHVHVHNVVSARLPGGGG